jgi:hypothetical protein
MRERGQSGNALPATAGSFLGGEFSTCEMGNFQPALTVVPEIRPLRAMWRGPETSAVRILGHSQRKRGAMDRPDLRSTGVSP